MTVLFIPSGQTFNANTVAGSGAVVRWTYTVPAGKRAQLRHCFVSMESNAAAANTLNAYVLVTFSAGGVCRTVEVDTAGSANDVSAFTPTNVDLSPGDTVQGISNNASAVGVNMIIQSAITEYQ